MSVPRILAIDQSKSTGWAFSVGRERAIFGTKEFPRGQYVENVRVWDLYRKWLKESIEVYGADTVVFEEPISSQKNKEVEWLLTGMCCLTEQLCYELGITCCSARADDWRQYFLGFSRAKDIKAHVIFKCRQLGYAVTGDNEGDAIGILHFAQNDLMSGAAMILAGGAQ